MHFSRSLQAIFLFLRIASIQCEFLYQLMGANYNLSGCLFSTFVAKYLNFVGKIDCNSLVICKLFFLEPSKVLSISRCPEFSMACSILIFIEKYLICVRKIKNVSDCVFRSIFYSYKVLIALGLSGVNRTLRCWELLLSRWVVFFQSLFQIILTYV